MKTLRDMYEEVEKIQKKINEYNKKEYSIDYLLRDVANISQEIEDEKRRIIKHEGIIRQRLKKRKPNHKKIIDKYINKYNINAVLEDEHHTISTELYNNYSTIYCMLLEEIHQI